MAGRNVKGGGKSAAPVERLPRYEFSKHGECVTGQERTSETGCRNSNNPHSTTTHLAHSALLCNASSTTSHSRRARGTPHRALLCNASSTHPAHTPGPNRGPMPACGPIPLPAFFLPFFLHDARGASPSTPFLPPPQTTNCSPSHTYIPMGAKAFPRLIPTGHMHHCTACKIMKKRQAPWPRIERLPSWSSQSVLGCVPQGQVRWCLLMPPRGCPPPAVPRGGTGRGPRWGRYSYVRQGRQRVCACLRAC